MKVSRFVSILLLVAVIIGIYEFTRQPTRSTSPAARVPLPAHPTAAIGGPADATLQAGPEASPDAPSELVVALNAPAGDVKADLRIVSEVFAAYRSGTRAENPVGENTEITAALTGKNAIDYAFIPKDCPAINPKGELCDRWGVPYFFHQLSGTEMEIRSAGPDRKLWTNDDVVLTPP